MFRKTQQIDKRIHDRHVRNGAHSLPHDRKPFRAQTLSDLVSVIVRANENPDRLGATAGLMRLPDPLHLVHERRH